MHLVLASFQRDASQYSCSFNTLSRTARSMTSGETMLKDDIQWVLNASQTLGWIIVFVVDMNVVVHDGVANILWKEVIIDKWLGGFWSKLHHHAGWCISIHVGIFTSNVIVFGIDNAHEYVTSLGFSRNVTLVAVSNVFLGYIFSGTLHEFQFYGILNGFYTHLALAAVWDVISYLLYQRRIFSFICM